MSNKSGTRLFVHQTVDSTMSVAERYLAFFTDGNFAVSAGMQTNGVGRHGRQWISPEGNLYVTIVKKLVTNSKTSQLSFVAAVAVGAFINEYLHKQCQYKWPNDIMVGGHKAAGILLRAHGDCVLTGVGINIISAPCDNAISLGKNDFAIEELCTYFVAIFDKFYAEWASDGFAQIRKAWMSSAMGLNQNVIISRDSRVVGKFLEIDADGAMILDNNGVVVKIVDAEQVRFVG